MVVDTSALIAILEEEPDAAQFAEAIAGAEAAVVSAASVLETGIVMMNRHGPEGAVKAMALIREAGVQVESVTGWHAQLALEAYERYGKGQGAKAGLNYGDCFSYALAKATGLPLLFKGQDFGETDIGLAPPPPH